jgi:hypothetical protein
MNPLQPGGLTDTALRNRFAAWQALDSAWRSGKAHADDVLATLQRDCEAARKTDTLNRLLHPPTPVVPVEAPTVRVKVLKPFRVFIPNRYGEHEEHSAAPDSIVDVPKSALRDLRDRVERVAPGTTLRQIPLGPNDHQRLMREQS